MSPLLTLNYFTYFPSIPIADLVFQAMRPPKFGDTEIKQENAVNPLPRIILHFRKPYQLNRIIDL